MLTIIIKIIPSSGRQAITLKKNNLLTCYLKSPPEDGKANKELIQFLAKALKIPQSAVTIVSGAMRRTKLIRIAIDHTYEQLLAALEIPEQLGLLK
jgi:uncharacterized protein